MAADERGIIFERLVRLEGVVRQQGDQQDDHGGVLDHLVNTLDTIVLPTQASHATQLALQQKALDEHTRVNTEVRDYMISQRGAWLFIQRFLLVLAALTGVATFLLTVKARGH